MTKAVDPYVQAGADEPAGGFFGLPPIVLTIGGWTPDYFEPGELHWHRCPTCYLSRPCVHTCTPEPDQDDEGRQHGAIVECDACRFGYLVQPGEHLGRPGWLVHRRHDGHCVGWRSTELEALDWVREVSCRP